MECLARCGFAAKGLVYALVGLLALEAALGIGGKTTDFTGALRVLRLQPFGPLLLTAVAIGFFGYALWRGVLVALNPIEPQPRGKSVLYRAAYAISGVTYGALGLTALRMSLDFREKHPHLEQALHFLRQPIGQCLMGFAGACVVGLGAYYLHSAYTARFRDELMLNQMSLVEERWVTLAGRVGHAARGVVFGLAGIFLIQAALHSNPWEVRGVGGVLACIAEFRYGPPLLGVVAGGLILYGGYMLVATRYRRVWA